MTRGAATHTIGLVLKLLALALGIGLLLQAGTGAAPKAAAQTPRPS